MGTVITSSDSIEINQNFRISAGPGAGKTHWLIEHIRHIVNESRELSVTRKVACITYTNVAVDEVKKRLGVFSNHVEVCTFHSFLFQHIVSPYWHLIAQEEGLNLEAFQGETEQIFTDLFEPIKAEIHQQYEKNNIGLETMLKHALWEINTNNKIEITINRKYRPEYMRIKNDFFIKYKHRIWSLGFVNYDDIHYFTYKLISKYPFIVNLVSSLFPYLVVDEFQDTTPIQALVLKKLSEVGTYIGVIGDKAQSIYSFNGVQANHFDSFSIDNINEYVILGNRRSTNQIIALLNCIRPDFQQTCLRNEDGEIPTLLIAPLEYAIDYCEDYCGAGNVKYLAYGGGSVYDIACHLNGGDYVQSKKLNNLSDSNYERITTIGICFKALEYAYNRNLSMAYAELKKIGLTGKNAYKLLLDLYNIHDKILEMSMYDFSLLLLKHGIVFTKLRNGFNVRHTYESIKYKQILKGENSDFKDEVQSTIHKAKGAQYQNVFIALQKEKDLNFLYRPSLQTNETSRVYYVAASRAKDKLFLNVPECNKRSQLKLQQLPISILILTDNGWHKIK